MAGGSSIKSLIGSIRRKPVNALDDRTGNDPAVNGNGKQTGIVHDLVTGNMKQKVTVAHALTTLASGEPLNDKELLLENGVSMLQGMAPNSGLSSTISDGFIKMLWSDLPHPSTTVAGPTTRYRRHDGGNNNLWNPEMGKAGTPYCRNVPPVKPKGNNLPDPELVFEQLLRRPDGEFREHPSGLNRLFFSFATIVIHECFQTSRKDQWINETSSYVDLSTLYGNTEKEQPRVRTYKNGLIYPDSIASERIMLMPPGVVALLVMFSRNHNQIAGNLIQINEQGKYRPWDSLDEEQKKWQDEDLFQLARNINVGFFATVVLKDYVAAILNTPRANSSWSLDLGKEIKSLGQRVERGSGNVVSVEFAVLYHWHAALSAADAKWMEAVIRHSLPDLKSLDDMTPELFYEVVKKDGHKLMETLPKDWVFGGYKRGPDGRFDDNDLSELIKGCIEEPAHAFGAHGTPASLKVVDIMGQLQARELFNVCTMNEFRKYLNLKPYESFEEWCEDKPTARAAELLYGHIENLELYPGLMAECTKPAMPGSGVCPGQTTGRGILDDAVALVRGDRYLSYDFNSNTLTNWGFSKVGQCQPGAYGGMIPKLLFRGLPGAFNGTSSYALLPFYTPKAVAGILKGNKATADYDITRPRDDGNLVAVLSHEGCKSVFEDKVNFKPKYLTTINPDSDGHETRIGVDEVKRLQLHPIFFEQGFEQKASRFFGEYAAQLIKDSSLKFRSGKQQVDVVRDVANVVPILYVADRLAIPVKSAKNPRGLLSISQLFDIFQVLNAYQSQNIVPENEWQLRETSRKVAPTLRTILESHLGTQSGNFKEKIVDRLEKNTAYEVRAEADRIYHALNATKLAKADLVGALIGMAVPIAANLGHYASVLINLYLSPGYESYKARIIELSALATPESESELQGFVFEGLRHTESLPGLPHVAVQDVTVNDGTHGPVHVKAGNTVLLGTSKAAMDSVAFPEPEKLNPARAAEDFALLGYGSIDAKIIGPALAATLREVFKLKNVRLAGGRLGHLTVIKIPVAGVELKKYLDASSRETALPVTLSIEYDS